MRHWEICFFFIISLTHQSIDCSPNELSPQQNNQNVDTLKLCKSIRGSPGSITHKFKFWGRRGELEKLAFYLKGVNLNHKFSGVSYIHLGCLNHPNSINLDKRNSSFKKECAKPNKQENIWRNLTYLSVFGMSYSSSSSFFVLYWIHIFQTT